jgi:hypothetical protein
MLLKANFYLLFGTCIEQSIEKMRCLTIYLFLFIQQNRKVYFKKKKKKKLQ